MGGSLREKSLNCDLVLREMLTSKRAAQGVQESFAQGPQLPHLSWSNQEVPLFCLLRAPSSFVLLSV